MQVPRSVYDGLMAAVNDLSAKSRELFLARFNDGAGEFVGADGAVPPESVAALREYAIALLDDVGGAASELAFAYGVDGYDAARAAAVGASLGASPAAPSVHLANEIAVRGMVDAVKKTGDAAAFAEECAGRVDYIARKSCGAAVVACGARDPRKPRYARVPQGGETCSFCFMLASRGAVYLSKENAGAVDHYHANCDCKVVPDWGDGIEGYDPEGLYERWSACERTVGGTEAAYAEWREMDEAARSKYKGDDDGERFSRFARARILREVESRDPRWLHEGKAPDIDYSDVPRDEFGHVVIKSDGFNSEDYDSDNIGKKGREWRDLFIHDALRESGMKVKPRPASAPDGYSNIDAEIGGKLYEFKSPEEPKEKPKPGRELAFIESNLRGAKKQFGNQFDESTGGRLRYDGPIRVVLSLRYRDVPIGDVESEVVRQMKAHGISEVLLVLKDGRLKRFMM